MTHLAIFAKSTILSLSVVLNNNLDRPCLRVHDKSMNGIITVKSIAKNVVVDCEAIYEHNQIKLKGMTSVTFSDFGMTNPHTLVLSTENDIQIQLELLLDPS
jgi:hypothetical protein